MDEDIMARIQHMLGHAFSQDTAYQRMVDAQSDFNEESAAVATQFEELRNILTPQEETVN